MQVSPTFPTRVLTGLALLLLVPSLLALNAPAFAWASALLVGLAIARGLTQFSVARARNAGFEMLWRHPHRNLSVGRRSEVHISAELRNRSPELLVLEQITALVPPTLDVTVEPTEAILPARSALPVRVIVRPLRVGIHGIQGLTVLVRSDISAFEAQLTFANPFVLEVRPCITPHLDALRRGGLGRVSAPANRTSPVSGDSLELRELREFRSGDPLRKIAWKASARRGRLLVRDDEQEHRHLVWFVLDASVELWAGHAPDAALDSAIDHVASMIRQSLQQGDRVGLCVVAARTLVRVEPDQGTSHEKRLIEALAHASSTLDFDRSSYDEQDAAAAVLEHMRPMDPVGTLKVSSKNLDMIATLAHRALERAQLAPRPEPLGNSPRERLFRKYIATFGIPSPPRTTPDRDLTDRELIETLKWLSSKRPDKIRVCSPWPRPRLIDGLSKLQRRFKKARIELEWIPQNVHYGLKRIESVPEELVSHTLEWRESVEATAGRLALRRLGIRDASKHHIVRVRDVVGT